MTLHRWTLALITFATIVVQIPVETQGVNPLLKPSPLPFQAPAFDKISNAHFLPAIEEGITQRLAEVEAIANSPIPNRWIGRESGAMNVYSIVPSQRSHATVSVTISKMIPR